ncbi:hypothetical protein LMH87_000960 [Akanthomyces muscarius]|nr:hypothetical protein LMH87_000960 [Akanthomyces muscarius]KAJ4155729.1 hypothetical protein LMH87_000960 [Akanthomyces muscarius]
MSTSPSGERTIWGTVAIPASPEIGATQIESRDDGWLNEAELLSNADLSMQLDAIHIAEQEDRSKPEIGNSTGSTGGGKKKKKQKITLMSTGGRRGF